MKGIVNYLGNIFKGRTMKRFVRNEHGGVVEYVLLLALLVLVCIAGLRTLGLNNKDAIDKLNTELVNATNGESD